MTEETTVRNTVKYISGPNASSIICTDTTIYQIFWMEIDNNSSGPFRGWSFMDSVELNQEMGQSISFQARGFK